MKADRFFGLGQSFEILFFLEVRNRVWNFGFFKIRIHFRINLETPYKIFWKVKTLFFFIYLKLLQ